LKEQLLKLDAWIINNERAFLLDGVKKISTGVWNYFLEILPDLMGYGTLVAGGAIIIGSMVGRGGLMKPLGFFAGSLIVATVILGHN